MSEAYVCISYFDQILGPTMLYCSDSVSPKSGNLPNLKRILEFNEEEGTFIYAFRKYQSINRIFHIPSDEMKFKETIAMISYLVKASSYKNEIDGIYEYLQSKETVLEQFSDQLKNTNEFKELINVNSQKSQIEESHFQLLVSKLKSQVEQALQDLNPPSSSINFEDNMSSAYKKIFIYGKENSGKKTFLKNVEVEQFYKTYKNDLTSQIYEVVIDNIHILAYDCPFQNFKCNQCKTYSGGCIPNTQGYIYLFDNSKKQDQVLKDISDFLQTITHFYQNAEMPIPIMFIGNRFKEQEFVSEERFREYIAKSQLNDKGNFILNYQEYNVLHEKDRNLEIIDWFIKNII